MAKLWLKSCPRCQGDVVREDDPLWGPSYDCIQCGHSLTKDQVGRITVAAGPA